MIMFPAPFAPRSIKSAARSGSTAFQVSPLTFSDDPTMQPSATANTSAIVSCLTPVFARTGTSTADFTASSALISAASPVICPDTSTASGTDENTALRARSASGRVSRLSANSAETLNKSARSSRCSRLR